LVVYARDCVEGAPRVHGRGHVHGLLEFRLALFSGQ